MKNTLVISFTTLLIACILSGCGQKDDVPSKDMTVNKTVKVVEDKTTVSEKSIKETEPTNAVATEKNVVTTSTTGNENTATKSQEEINRELKEIDSIMNEINDDSAEDLQINLEGE